LETDYFHYTPAIIAFLDVANFTIIAGVFLLLLIIAMLIAGAEVAVLSLSAASLEKLGEQKDRRNIIILSYAKDPERLHLTVSIATVFIIILNFSLLLHYSAQFAFMENCGWFLVIMLALAFSLVVLTFTELIPRYFARIAEKYIYAFAYPMMFIEILFSPVSYLIWKLTNKHGKRLQNGKHQISIEDISNALQLTSDANSEKEDILQGIVNFGNMDVQKILKPRIDVVAVDKDTDSETLYHLIIESGYSRIPVYSEVFDNLLGILYVKDLLPHFANLPNFDWTSLIRPAYFVPETKKVKELLKELQAQKIHMAVVIDEYGGATGIVTLEDILEEIVGEISDESDEDEETFRQIDEYTYIFDGITLLNDFYRITQTDESLFNEVRGDADTIAGLIMELKGEIPENGDLIEFHPFTFVIEQIDNRRIKQIRVIITPDTETENREL
jgi:gliding motility-associated protein GldE